jgi:hypothetical protein
MNLHFVGEKLKKDTVEKLFKKNRQRLAFCASHTYEFVKSRVRIVLVVLKQILLLLLLSIPVHGANLRHGSACGDAPGIIEGRRKFYARTG